METLIKWGYFGLLIGSFCASTIIPFSSDALLVGMLAIGSNVWLCLLTATLGNWAGGLTSYWLGYAGNMEKIERRFKNSAVRLERHKKLIDKYGQWLSFFAWLPVVGDFFSISLGFFKVNFKLTAFWMLVGRFVRFLFWCVLYLCYK